MQEVEWNTPVAIAVLIVVLLMAYVIWAYLEYKAGRPIFPKFSF